MPRKRRKRTEQRPIPGRPQWRWRTLPVWLALTGGFTIGWYVAAAGAGTDHWPGGWSYYVQLAVVLAFSFGLSRVFSYLVAMRVQRRRAPKGLHPMQQQPRPGKRPEASP